MKPKKNPKKEVHQLIVGQQRKSKKNKDSLTGALCKVLNLRRRFIGGRGGSSGEWNEGGGLMKH